MAVKALFWGLVTLESAFRGVVVTRNSSDVPINADSTPIYRVYGPAGIMTNGTGSLSFKDTGTVTGATNASPIVITTSAAHNLQTGVRVTITGVAGNTAANGTFAVTVVTTTTFSLDSSTGNGAYTSGGTYNVSGVYDFNFTPQAANGFASGVNYYVFVQAVISATTTADLFSFTVT